MPQHLTHELKITSLLEDRRSRIVPQGMGTDLPRKPGPNRQAMENVCRVAACEAAPYAVNEEVVLQRGFSTDA